MTPVFLLSFVLLGLLSRSTESERPSRSEDHRPVTAVSGCIVSGKQADPVYLVRKVAKSRTLAFPGNVHYSRVKNNRTITLMTRLLHPTAPLKPYKTCICIVCLRTWICGEDWSFSHYELNSDSEAPDALGACTSLCYERSYKGSQFSSDKFS